LSVLSNCSFNLLGLVKALPLPVTQSGGIRRRRCLILKFTRSFGKLFQRLRLITLFFDVIVSP
jgi:hypothetical protein